MSDQTTIRINLDTRDKLKAFGSTGQSMDGIINDLLEIAEKAGTIPAPETGPNTGFNDELTRLNDKYTNVVKSIHELNERLDSLIPGIEHQRDETGHALEMVFSIQKRLEALEALPVTIPAHTPDDKPEENPRGDDNDQGQEQDEVSEERKKIIDRIKYLNKECKISYAKIAIGIGLKNTDKGRISEAINPKIRCPLTKEQIEKLFLIEKSSSEAL
jgi:hypothetical protein